MTDKEEGGPDIKVCLSVGPIKILVAVEHYRALSIIAKHATILVTDEDKAHELDERSLGVAIYLGGGVLKDEQQTDVPTRH